MDYEEIIMHIDVNSAYLSFEAAYRIQHGEQLDLRSVPSVVGGNQATRHGIVLAKSDPAKSLVLKQMNLLWKQDRKCLTFLSYHQGMIAWFNHNEYITPLKFKLPSEGG